MSCDKSSPPLAEQPKLEASRDINGLSDADLAAVFKRLPLYERLIVSEVCKRWRDISRMPWTEIIHLDLSPIPGPNIAAIVKQCPNVKTVFAKEKAFAPNELAMLSRIPLSTVTLFRCSLKKNKEPDPFSALFSNNLQNAIWSELSIGDFKDTFWANYSNPIQLPVCLGESLLRLQLSGIPLTMSGRTLVQAFGKLPNLECLIFGGCVTFTGESLTPNVLLQMVGGLKKLREFCFTGIRIEESIEWCHWRSSYSPPCDDLADIILTQLCNLEVLIMAKCFLSSEALTKLTTTHPALRIFGITGEPLIFGIDTESAEILLPKRQLYPNGFEANPVPFLHFFVGKKFAEIIRFTKSPNATEIHPITSPLPAFLDQPEIAEIFKDVWLAEKIRELAQAGGELWKYEPDVTPTVTFAKEP